MPRLASGNIKNQLLVLLQHIRRMNRDSAKILMPQAMREILYQQMKHSAAYKRTDQGDLFCNIPIVIDNTLKEILIRLEEPVASR